MTALIAARNRVHQMLDNLGRSTPGEAVMSCIQTSKI